MRDFDAGSDDRSSSTRSGSDPPTRREVLHGSATAGLWGLFGSRSGRTESRRTARDVAATAVDGSSIANVCDHGAALDGETDDAAALRDAFAAAGPSGTVYVPPGGRLRLGSGVVFDLEASGGFQLVCDSPVTPDPGIGNAVTVTNGFPQAVAFYVRGGGQTADYRLPDPEGGDQALVLQGVRGGEYTILAHGYRGRVLRTAETENGVKTSKLRIPQLETRMIDRPCGQAFYLEGQNAVVHMGDVWTFWDKYGPVVSGVYDFSVEHVESGWNGDGGLAFINCGSIHADSLALGDESHSVDLVRFSGCHGVNVNRVFAVGGQRGLVIEESTDVTVGSVYGANNAVDVVVGDGTARARVSLTTASAREGAVIYAGDGQNRLDVAIEGGGGPGVEVTGAASGRLALSGSVVGTDGSGVVVKTPAPVKIHNLRAEANLDADLVVPEDNEIRVSHSAIDRIQGTPKALSGIGRESAARERPDPDIWRVGDIVEFTDTGDGTGDGVYLRLPDERWTRIDTVDAESTTGTPVRAETTETRDSNGTTPSTTTSSTTADETSTGTPGFDAVTTALALAGAALLAARDGDEGA